jgi:hypothetical protein
MKARSGLAGFVTGENGTSNSDQKDCAGDDGVARHGAGILSRFWKFRFGQFAGKTRAISQPYLFDRMSS